MAFHVGDKVRGLPTSPYSVTCPGWIGYVIDTDYDYSGFDIKVCARRNGNDNYFWVKSKYFELVEPAVEKRRKSIW